MYDSYMTHIWSLEVRYDLSKLLKSVRFGLPRRQLLKMARRADKNKDGGLGEHSA